MKEIGSWRRKTCSWPRNSLSLSENEFVVKLESFSWNCAGLDVSAVIETLLTFHSSSFRLIRTCLKGCKIRNLLFKKNQQVFISMTPRPLNLPPTQQHCFQIGNTKIQPLKPNAKKSAECSPSQKKGLPKKKKKHGTRFLDDVCEFSWLEYTQWKPMEISRTGLQVGRLRWNSYSEFQTLLQGYCQGPPNNETPLW